MSNGTNWAKKGEQVHKYSNPEIFTMKDLTARKIVLTAALVKLPVAKSVPDQETLDFWLTHAPEEHQRVKLMTLLAEINEGILLLQG